MSTKSAELDRKLLHVKTLYDTSRELSALTEPQHVLSTFLLMTMGPLGATSGFILFMEQGGTAPVASARGIDEYDEAELSRHSQVINDALFGPECRLPGRVEIINNQDTPGLPDSTKTLIRWCGPGTYEGLFGLGDMHAQGGSAIETEEFLHRLTGILISSLRGATAQQEVEKLNDELARQNEDLERAMAMADTARRELDRKIFELDTLYEATNELSGLVETKGILDTFLLTAMGAFAAKSGGIYLHDVMFPKLIMRGEDKSDEAPSRGQVMGVLTNFFKSEDAPNPIAMSARVLTGDKVLKGAAFPFEATIAIAFAVNENLRGLMVLGPRLNDEPYRMGEQQLLKALTGNFLIFLKNARYFEEITGLNDDLIRRNEDLNKALSEVSACKLELSDVELAKEKILGVIERETSRSNRVRRSDFLLITLMAICIGWVFNFTNPHGVALTPVSMTREAPAYIDAQWAKLKQDSGEVIFVDARPAAQFQTSHIRGAVNVPSALFDFVYAMRFANLEPETEIVVYGHTISKLYDEDVAHWLRERDFENVKVLSGGLDAWEAKGYPVNR